MIILKSRIYNSENLVCKNNLKNKFFKYNYVLTKFFEDMNNHYNWKILRNLSMDKRYLIASAPIIAVKESSPNSSKLS